MTKFKDNVDGAFHQDNGTVKYPKAIPLKTKGLVNVFTHTGKGSQYNKGKYLNKVMTTWENQSKGDYQIVVLEAFVDRSSIDYINTEERAIAKVSDTELSELDMEELIFKRFIVKIGVKGFDPEYAPVIVANFNEKGDQYAFGTNVNICDNLTIMTPTNILSTFEPIEGAGKGYTILSLDNIFGQLTRYMQDLQYIMNQDLKKIETWKSKIISQDEFYCFLGKQYTKIQRANAYRLQKRIKELSKDEKTLTVTGQQLGKVAAEAADPRHKIYKWDGTENSLWSVINFGTEVIKPQRGSDIATLLRTNAGWVNLVDTYFNS